MPGHDPKHQRLEEIFHQVVAPFAFVDLDAMRSNAQVMLGQAGSKPIRIASKSIRSRAILERIMDLDSAFRGLLTFTLPETLFLAENGWDDLVCAYPTVDTETLAELAIRSAANPSAAPVVMVDSAEHLELIEHVLGTGAPQIRVCIDVDAGFRKLGGRLDAGVKRSPLRTVRQVVDLAESIVRRPRLKLVGLMAYEAQIAGVGDRPPGKPLRGASIRWMQKRSAAEIAERRAEIVAAVSRLTELEFVNGGGTGSISLTVQEDAVTEVAAGSGFYAPAQFDHYSRIRFKPAAAFAMPVVRNPGPGIATVLGGGYPASGPGDSTRLPVPWLPPGLEYDSFEGAGEVQTPLLGEATDRLELGDRVYFRHVKAGELCERFNRLYLVEGDEIVDEVPTYRGEGRCFL